MAIQGFLLYETRIGKEYAFEEWYNVMVQSIAFGADSLELEFQLQHLSVNAWMSFRSSL